MSLALQQLTDNLGQRVYNALVPPRQDTSWQEYGADLVYKIVSLALFILPALACRFLNGCVCLTQKSLSANPHQDFSTVCENSRLWSQIDDVATRTLPLQRFGIAICDYQYTPPAINPNAQWTHWMKDHLPREMQPTFSVNFWARREEMIEKIVASGVNEFRFSLEWSRIQPHVNTFNEREITRVRELCVELKSKGIEPMITLMHFTHPQWLEEKGGFETEEAIKYFLAFSTHVFDKLSPVCKKWCTINEPGIVSFMGWIMGAYPPGRFLDFKRCAYVLKNLLLAHVDVYEALKCRENGEECEIGVTHQCLKFKPYSKWNPIETAVANLLTEVTHETIMRFFETGTFSFQIPLLANVVQKIERARARYSLDFLGVQYYARPLISLLGRAKYPWEGMTSMPFRDDPAGIYEILLEIHRRIDRPIVITETGIATHDDNQRKAYYEKVCYAAGRALEKGVDLQGIHMWSLTRNFEWHEGMPEDPRRGQDFGLYAMEEEGDPLTLRPSAEAYLRHAKTLRANTRSVA